MSSIVQLQGLTKTYGKGSTQVTALAHYACWSHCIDLIHHFVGPLAQLTAIPGVREFEGAGLRATDVAGAFVTESGATGTILGTSGIHFGFPA